MDFIANATGSIFAQGWTPELQKMVGGKQDAAGLLKAVQAEYAEGTQPVTSCRRRGLTRRGDPPVPPAAARRRARRRVPASRGVRRQPLVGLAVRAAGPRHVRAVRPAAAALTVQYSLYRWDGVGPATWVGLVELRDGPDASRSWSRPCSTRSGSSLFFSFIPVALGLRDRERHPPGRHGPPRRDRRARVLFLPQVIPLVAAGIIWGRLLSLTGLVNQALTADRPGRHHPGLAGRLRHGAAGRRAHRDLGPARASAPCCC